MLVEAGQPTAEAGPFGFVLESFTPVAEAWLSWIDPVGYIVAHRDGGPYRERWQVPIRPSGTWNGDVHHVAGVPFQVTHWEPHSVANDGRGPRVHIVIDRDVIANPSTAPFTIEETNG